MGCEEVGHYFPRLESGLPEVSGNPAPCLQELCCHPVTNPPARPITSVFLCACPAPLCWVESFLQVRLVRYPVQELTQTWEFEPQDPIKACVMTDIITF